MSNVQTARILRRDNRRWERDSQPGAASRRAMQLDRQTRQSREQDRPNPKPPIAMLRRSELIRIYESRCGPTWPELPNDDAGLDYVRLYADHCGASDFDILKTFCEKHAPWMTAEEVDGVFVQRRRQPWTADDLATDLHLMDAHRARLGIRTIGAVDYSKAARTKRNKRIRRDRERKRHEAAGAKPRSQSLSALKPWERENPPTKRSTWYRRKRAGQVAEIDSCAVREGETVRQIRAQSGRP